MYTEFLNDAFEGVKELASTDEEEEFIIKQNFKARAFSRFETFQLLVSYYNIMKFPIP